MGLRTLTNLLEGRLALRRLPRGSVETAVVFSPRGEWCYCHHASLAFFRGRFHAIWSNGRLHEDDAGQRVMHSSSPDGLAWERPEILVKPRRGRRSVLTLTAAGMHAARGRLVAYFGSWEWSRSRSAEADRMSGFGRHLGTMLSAVYTRDGGRWSRPVSLGLPMVPNHGPQRLSSGRLVISGNVMFPYTDAPSGLSGWTPAGIYPRALPFEFYDDSEGFPRASRASGGRLPWLCEGSFFEDGRGALHMLLRSGVGFLWETVSRDRGESWSRPRPTRFTDEGSKFHLGRLPDGRLYCVSNPDSGGLYDPGRRSPLAVALSPDGLDWRRGFILRGGPEGAPPQRRRGVHKGTGYQYPHSLVRGKHLYVAYSVNKEDVAVSRVRIEGLD